MVRPCELRASASEMESMTLHSQPRPIMREIGRNSCDRLEFSLIWILMTASATKALHIMPMFFMPLLFKSNIMMMILMWSNIGFKLSARTAFPGNFQPLKVQLFFMFTPSAPNRRVFHFIAYAKPNDDE